MKAQCFPAPCTEPRQGQSLGIHWEGETGSSEQATRESSEFQATGEVVVVSRNEIRTSHNLVEGYPLDPLTLAVQTSLHERIFFQLYDNLVPRIQLSSQNIFGGSVNGYPFL